jgi:murein DD-endopeptidase MepM/ murein hydrolase activator NlpD
MRRPGRTLAIALGVVGLLTLLCCGGTVIGYAYETVRGEANAAQNASGQGANCGGRTVDASGKLPDIASLNKEQIHNAAIIVAAGQQMQVPPRGWVIAVATALQESTLHNYGNLGARNDHDSLGLFQQRPSMGWGTPAQIMDPEYASRKFYEKLLSVPGWQSMPLTEAAQRVQRSAYPDAYAKHEPLATAIVNSLTDGAARAVGDLVSLRCAGQRQIAASGWTDPVPGTHLSSGFRTSSRPTHNGADLTAGKGTPIYAAAAGVVTLAKCDAGTIATASKGCDQDGGPQVRGCGWYVEILHAGNVITRYCHMLERPMVSVGQIVKAGQQIGVVGNTGHSSGPHCHFEVHLGGDRSSSGAIDPEPFMRERGVPLGQSA